MDDDVATRVERLRDLDHRLQLLEAYVAVLEERAAQLTHGEEPTRRLQLVQ